jgi:hypothetical protein
MAQAKHDSITRRALLSGAAVVPAAAIAGMPALAPPDFAGAPSGLPPAVPSRPDPIFAAIEAHRCAYAALDAFIPELADIEQAAWHAPRGKRRAANRRLKQAYAEERRLGGILSDEQDRFAATVADTLPGAAAAIAHVRAHYAQGYPMCDEGEDIVKLLASIETAIRRAAGLPMLQL